MSVKVTVTRFAIRPASVQRLVEPRVEKAGKVVAERAKANVNRYGRVDTGRMRDTIKAEAVKVNGPKITVDVVAPAPYSRFQHWGTRWITPAPFLTDALESLRVSDFR